jgi:membrane protein
MLAEVVMRSVIKQALFLLRETSREWAEDGAAGIAASLAYYTIFSLSPLLIVIALFLGLVLDEASIQTSVIDGARSVLGDSGSEFLAGLLLNQQRSTGDVVGTIIWISVVLWGASGLFAQLQSALNKIWEVRPVPGRPPTAIVKARLFSFLTVIVIGVVLLLTMLINTALSRLLLQADNPALAYVVRPAQFLITTLMTTVLIAAVFKILPDVMIRWHDLWVGAFVTALLFYIGQLVLSIYLSRANVGSVFGAAGSLTAILVWIYYSAQIMLFGAEFTEVWARYHGAYIRPDDDAMWISEAQARREAHRARIHFYEDDGHEHKVPYVAAQRARQMAHLKRLKRLTPVRRRASEAGDNIAQP